MRYDTASSTYTLQIKDVQRPDEGTYQCQIIVATSGNKVTKHVKLTVAQPPVIADNSTRSVVVQENSPAELICHALGSPPPSVSWRRQNNAVLPTGGIQVWIRHYVLASSNELHAHLMIIKGRVENFDTALPTFYGEVGANVIFVQIYGAKHISNFGEFRTSFKDCKLN